MTPPTERRRVGGHGHGGRSGSPAASAVAVSTTGRRLPRLLLAWLGLAFTLVPSFLSRGWPTVVHDGGPPPSADPHPPPPPPRCERRSLAAMPLGRSSHSRLGRALPRWRLHCIEAWVFVYDESEDLRWDAGLNVSGVATSGEAPWVRYYHRPGFKFGYFRAELTPAATAAYEYILLVDADCTFDTFGVGDFLGVLRRHELRIAQPAVLPRAGGRPAAARANRVSLAVGAEQPSSHVGRYTTVVEGGPLVAFESTTWACVWGMLLPGSVSGWGLDLGWCRYAETRCGVPLDEESAPTACAVVDATPIVHLDEREGRAAAAPPEANRKELRSYMEHYPDLYQSSRLGFYHRTHEPLRSLERPLLSPRVASATASASATEKGTNATRGGGARPISEAASRVRLLRHGCALNGLYVRAAAAATVDVYFVQQCHLRAVWRPCHAKCNGLRVCQAAVRVPGVLIEHLGHGRPFICGKERGAPTPARHASLSEAAAARLPTAQAELRGIGIGPAS